MSALVSYQSSDDDDDGDVKAPEASHAASTASHPVKQGSSSTAAPHAARRPSPDGSEATAARPQPAALPSHSNGAFQPPTPTMPGPSLPTQLADDTSIPTDPSLSPYSSNRARIQSLTMPRFANFDIPPSPPPPDPTSDEAADLLARTRKFERFLQLKAQGVHFNDRLERSTALRNPALMQKLLAFAGVDATEQYDNTLGDAVRYPTKWPDGFLEGLMKDNEARVTKEREGRSRVEFVGARKKGG